MEGESQYWIPADQRVEIVWYLFRHGMIQHDPSGQLPLTGSGKTDLKIRLGNGRNYPPSLEYMAKLFERPLRALRPSRFVEIPLAMCCYSGLIANKLKMPFVTARTEPKARGGDDAEMIPGPFNHQETVAIIDDVITDGRSKIPVIKNCTALGAYVNRLVVLVDREEGWKANFHKAGIGTGILWAGMTLSHVREILNLPAHASQ